MITGLSSDNLFLNFRETWLKIIFHKCLSFFLILFTLCHDHLQNIFLMIDKSELTELNSHSLTCLNVRTDNVVTVRNIRKKVWSGDLVKHWDFHQFRQKFDVIWNLTFNPTPTAQFLCLSIKIKICWLKEQ